MTTHHILLVDSDTESIALMRRALAGLGELRLAPNGSEALRMARETVPDVILMAVRIPGLNGFQACEAVRADPQLDGVPVVLIADDRDPQIEASGLEIGAADVVARPLDAAVVTARVKAQLRQKRQTDELRRLLAIDALTGLANRSHLDEALHREWRRAHRAGEPLALLRVEIDHFQRYREHYGDAAEACLKTVAQVLRTSARRPADGVAHLGDQRFALLLPSTDRDGAQHMGHRVLDAIESRAIPHAASPLTNHVTVSVGIGCYDRLSECWIGPNADDSLLGKGRLFRTANDLQVAAEAALAAAQHAGHARAMMQDVADVGAAHRITEIAPERREASR